MTRLDSAVSTLSSFQSSSICYEQAANSVSVTPFLVTCDSRLFLRFISRATEIAESADLSCDRLQVP